MKITRVLTYEEWAELSSYCETHEGYYRNDRRLFTPGMAWFMPWVFDPTGERERAGEYVIYKLADRAVLLAEAQQGHAFLSVHYWQDWSEKRSPITVVAPNGEWWEIDRKSSNGTGWTVTGDLPDITCAPSIVVPGYHGFLRAGEFTADLEGRGPNGLARA